MNINTKIEGNAYAQLQSDVKTFNASTRLSQHQDPNKEVSQMGKDDFLKLLTVQLSKQNPLSPMNNTEFIAQMAQFSALEQMTKVNKSINKMSNDMGKWQAQNLIGKHVTFFSEATQKEGAGVVSEVWMEKDKPKVLVGNDAVLLNEIKKVMDSKKVMDAKKALEEYQAKESTKEIEINQIDSAKEEEPVSFKQAKAS